MTKEELFKAWLAKLATKADRQKKHNPDLSGTGKRYRHLDSSISFNGSAKSEALKRQLQDVNEVRCRSFYPFLKMVLEKPRFSYEKHEGNSIKKKIDPKPRDIYYAAHKDSAFYAWYGYLLTHHYEQYLNQHNLQECSLAYRSIRKQTTIHFANTAFNKISSYDSCVVMAFDVSKFFDHLNHQILKSNWARVIDEAQLPADHYNIFKSLTRFRYLPAEQVKDVVRLTIGKKGRVSRYCFPKEFRKLLLPLEQRNNAPFGIPQGTPLSAVLANIYMIDFDAHLNAFAQSCNGFYRRYSDDILLVVPEDQEATAHHIIQHQLNQVHLPLNHKKTEVRYFNRQPDGSFTCSKSTGQSACMQYLGLEFDGNNILVRSASWARYHQKLRKAVRKAIYYATGKKSKADKVFMRKLYTRFTSLSKRSNFIKYVQRVERVTGSEAVKKQYKDHVPFLQKLVKKEYTKALQIKHERSVEAARRVLSAAAAVEP